ncbi:MAG: hypothetical protein LC775_07965, partial [Acidobacteria bacterium]|nr:hypothetical protein [Acidobacteriota bacterium]
MTPERWRQVEVLFHSVLEREPGERAGVAECAGHEVLRREVEALIEAHEREGSFIDAPAYAVATGRLAEGRTESLVEN